MTINLENLLKNIIILDEFEFPRIGDLVTNTHLGNKGRECSGIVNGYIGNSVSISTAERHNGKRYFCESADSLKILRRDNKATIYKNELFGEVA